ncbi:putative transcription factor interactor and regulator CCHC(Zn) family [Lupinus albus]|uniref:Putative transcription factor interactor and regulator CCHC(Zn) family n=1 Tax=Lupinus albus TaxID=3870 RepID=A0A6A4NRF5_LUPAL|nr:putative transcription factor interactor and regulator CCHC(Zn) family [Lupinus albus]
MALRNDFEGLRGSILHRTPLPSVDSVVNELLAEKVRLKSHSEKGIVDKGILPSPSVFATPVVKGKSQGRVNYDECSFCKEKGHWKAQCPKLLKKEQPYQPPQWRLPQSKYRTFQHTSQSSNVAAATAVSPSATPGMVHSGSNMSDLVEQFQKFLASQPNAMSVSPNVGLSSAGSSGISSSIWILDSGASHHMSSDFKSFTSVHKSSCVSVMTADGTPMLLEGDPQSKRLIGTGHRQGGLYILDELKLPHVAAPTVDLSSFRLNLSSSKFYLWHSRLGHVSSPRLNT